MTDPQNTVTAGGAQLVGTPGRPGRPAILGALFVDMDNVRARYECLRPGCTHQIEGPVYGETDVKAFVDTIRTDHPARCTGESR